jgi:hypothetical protein
MMEAITAQLDLFDPMRIESGGYRWDDPQTSKDAAQSINVAKLERDYLTILAKFPGGLTNQEIADNSEMHLNSVSPRSAPLQRKGLIKDSGERRLKRTVWVITEMGRAAL